MSAKVLTKAAAKEAKIDLIEDGRGTQAVHDVVVAMRAARRSGSANTKTKAEVDLSGAKPWRQKGTGRARQGSIRAPQWAGGGVAHGPVVRDHDQRINKKMRRGALRSALTDAHASGKLAVVEELSFEEPKTKRAVEILDALQVEGRILVVLAQPSETGAVEKSFRNLVQVRVSYAGGLGTYDVLLADRIVVTTEALDALEGVAAGWPAATAETGAGERS